MKKTIIIIIALIIIGVGYYALSPLWKRQTVNEVSPIDTLPTQTQSSGDDISGMENLSPLQRIELETQMALMASSTNSMSDTMPNQAVLIAKGDFVSSAHNVEGQALYIESGNSKTLRLENFTTLNGPDVRMYLSADLKAENFVDLGKIKATDGNINYDVPADTDFTKYPYVLVWCEDFNVLFGYSEVSY